MQQTKTTLHIYFNKVHIVTYANHTYIIYQLEAMYLTLVGIWSYLLGSVFTWTAALSDDWSI